MSRSWILPETLLEMLPEMSPKSPPGLKSLTRATNLGKPCHPRAERTIWPISLRGASLQAVSRYTRRLLLRPCVRRKPAPFSECSPGRRFLKDRPWTRYFFLYLIYFSPAQKMDGSLFLYMPHPPRPLALWHSFFVYHSSGGIFTCLIDTTSCDFL